MDLKLKKCVRVRNERMYPNNNGIWSQVCKRVDLLIASPKKMACFFYFIIMFSLLSCYCCYIFTNLQIKMKKDFQWKFDKKSDNDRPINLLPSELSKDAVL